MVRLYGWRCFLRISHFIFELWWLFWLLLMFHDLLDMIYIYIYIYIPFKKSVKTNVAKIFFRLLAKHFPRANKLYKIFNRNAAKVSCSCKENVCQIIKKHNNYVSRKKAKSTPSCNCWKKDDCPINGNCLINNVRCNI